MSSCLESKYLPQASRLGFSSVSHTPRATWDTLQSCCFQSQCWGDLRRWCPHSTTAAYTEGLTHRLAVALGFPGHACRLNYWLELTASLPIRIKVYEMNAIILFLSWCFCWLSYLMDEARINSLKILELWQWWMQHKYLCEAVLLSENGQQMPD